MKRATQRTTIFLTAILLLSHFAFAFPARKSAEPILSRSWMRTQDGWIVLHIEGKPYDRGFQYGYRLADEITHYRGLMALEFQHNTKQKIDVYYDQVEKLYWDHFDVEYQEEMRGMADGAKYAGKEVSLRDVLVINTYYEIGLWWDTVGKKQFPEPQKDHCSSFIAVGEMTKDGDIVLAHNTWFDYYAASFCRIILEIVPQKGHKIFMQNNVGMLYSETDFFITDAGLVGSETTIGDFKGYDVKGDPVSVRARRAMQYADNITEWVELISRGNNGAYANAWLIGDIETREIARLELGLKYESLERTRNGYFAGSNIAENANILQEETGSNPNNANNGCVARRLRWQQLMRQNKGKIDAEAAKMFLADHYDTYLGFERPGPRTLCGHVIVDATRPDDTETWFGGAFDGKVVTGAMAKQWGFWARWGCSCGIGFDAKKFLTVHPQFEWAKAYFQDIKPAPWTFVAPGGKKKK